MLRSQLSQFVQQLPAGRRARVALRGADAHSRAAQMRGIHG